MIAESLDDCSMYNRQSSRSLWLDGPTVFVVKEGIGAGDKGGDQLFFYDVLEETACSGIHLLE